MNTPLWVWGGFFILVLLLLCFDLGLFLRKDREIGVRESLRLSAFYIIISLCFALAIYYFSGSQAGKNFLTGYLIEKSLSMDNVFAMSMVFAHFYIPRRYQRRVLLFGVLGVIMLRGIMIALGAALIQNFHWVLYLFGALLIFSGVQMLYFSKAEENNLNDNKLLTWLRKKIDITVSLHGNQFFAYEKDPHHPGQSVRKATPLFLVLIFIELTDIMFATDSVPAVFAVTSDPFIVYTSNVFAILGLRALYFTLAAMLHRFAYLKYALALVLLFIGSKIFLVPFIGNVPAMDSLFVTLAVLAGGVILSLYKTKEDTHAAGE